MKPFLIPNFGLLDLELIIGDVTYTNEQFTLDGIGSTSGSTAITADLKIEGTITDFERLKNANKVVVNLVTDTETLPYLVMYAKHPITYDGKIVTVDLDTTPAATYVSFTSASGLKVPYSFGKPRVRLPQVVAEVSSAVLTKSYYSMSRYSVLGLIDLYTDALPGLLAVRRYGIGDLSTLKSAQRFLAEIDRLKVLAPDKIQDLDELATLLDWEGSQSRTDSEILGVNQGSLWHVADNVGFPPPISAYMLIDTVGREYESPTERIHTQDIYAYRNVKTGARATLFKLVNDYFAVCNRLMQPPATMYVDLGDAPIADVTLAIGGLDVKGMYADGELTVISAAPKALDLTFSEAVGTSSTIIAAGAASYNLEGMYLKVQVTPAYYSYTTAPVVVGNTTTYQHASPPDLTGVVKVLSQVGDNLTVSTLPYTAEGVTKYNADDIEVPLVKIVQNGAERSGTVLAYSTTVEGANYENTDQLVLGTVDTWTLQTAIAASYNTVTATGSSSDTDHSYEDSGSYSPYSIPVGKYLVDKDVDYIQLRNDVDSPLEVTDRGYRVILNAYQNTEYTWALDIGAEVAIGGVDDTYYIVDARPNILVTAVTAKIGEAYSLVEPAMYEVIPDYLFNRQTVTAIRVKGSLILRGLSDTLVATVDTTEYTVSDQVTGLATVLGLMADVVTAFPDTTRPNFVRYGSTLAAEIIADIAEQARGAVVITSHAVRIKYLNSTPAEAPYVLDANNCSDFELYTTDTLDLVHDTQFSWDNFRSIDNKAVVRLEDQVDTLNQKSEVKVTIFEDRASSIEFAKWHVHREGRDWTRVRVTGFVTELHLEVLDHVSFDVEGTTAIGEITGTSYDHDTGEVKFEVILCTAGVSLWVVGLDVFEGG